MTTHLTELAAEHGIQVTWVPRWQLAQAFAATKHAYVPVIRRPSDYLFGLHEIGHVLAPHSLEAWDEPGSYAAVLCEGAAWAWASQHAKPSLARHLRKADWDRVAYAYRTYLAEHARLPPAA